MEPNRVSFSKLVAWLQVLGTLISSIDATLGFIQSSFASCSASLSIIAPEPSEPSEPSSVADIARRGYKLHVFSAVYECGFYKLVPRPICINQRFQLLVAFTPYLARVAASTKIPCVVSPMALHMVSPMPHSA